MLINKIAFVECLDGKARMAATTIEQSQLQCEAKIPAIFRESHLLVRRDPFLFQNETTCTRTSASSLPSPPLKTQEPISTGQVR
jgi:hypothetical protein